MQSNRFRAHLALLALVFSAMAVFGFEVDDTVPEVTDRVARISFLRGEVLIKRAGAAEWERAALNLPIVEGDEIVTRPGSLLEVQLGKDLHARVSESSAVQLKELSEAGIAFSVTEGTIIVRPRQFDENSFFLEIDAPGTTIAVRKEGAYRIDAGTPDRREVRVTVTDEGEARVYSLDSGFTLRSGRSSTIVLDGDLKGEWETGSADRIDDEFRAWSAERDEVVAKALANAQFGKYYDQDIYGAEELNDNGDWEYTADYGHVWRPHASAINVYDDWSPYRYGTWRWIPPFGWTWVNDEPWGWATYHYGRWIWHRGRWVWAPYGYYRTTRSWWSPALVVIRVINRNVCWYPLGYRDRYHDWVGNRGPRDRRDRDRDQRPGSPVVVPSPVPSPGFAMRGKVVPNELPPVGVITMTKDEFGTGRGKGQRANPDLIKGVIARKDQSPAGELPDFSEVKPRIGREILVRTKDVPKAIALRKVGASERTEGKALDNSLRNERFYGNRTPVTRPQGQPDGGGANTVTQPIRGAGAVRRPERPVVTVERSVQQPATKLPSTGVPNDGGAEIRRSNEGIINRPVPLPRYEPPVRSESPKAQVPSEKPKPTPPLRNERPVVEKPTPRREPPVSTPRNDPPPRREPPKSDPPKSSPPPTKETPKPSIRRVKESTR